VKKMLGTPVRVSLGESQGAHEFGGQWANQEARALISDPSCACFLVWFAFFLMFCMGKEKVAAKMCSDRRSTNGVEGILIRAGGFRFDSCFPHRVCIEFFVQSLKMRSDRSAANGRSGILI
jgi:hypothetical protein